MAIFICRNTEVYKGLPCMPWARHPWLAFIVAIFTGHENGGNKGQPKDHMYKACWSRKTLQKVTP